MRPSVTHVLAPAPFGGLETVVAELTRAQAAAGHRVRVVAVIDGPEGEGHPFVTRARSAGIEVDVARGTGRAYHREAAEIRDRLIGFRPEVVHTHGYRADVIAGWVAGRLAIRRVSTVHGFTGGDRKNRLFEWLQVRALCRYDCVVPVSRPLIDRLAAAGVPRSRMVGIQNAVSSPDFASREESRVRLGLPLADRVVGFVGRLGREKGCDVLIESLAVGTAGRFTLAIVGAGPERSELEARAAGLGIEGKVRWLGPVAAMSELLPAFDCLAMPSRTEGTPMVLLEAMLAETPVVATAVGGIPDVVTDREAVLVAAENPVALARGIEQVLDHPEESRERARRAQARALAEFGAEVWVDRYLEVYRSVLG
jgi:L-malate glycosyltransferase